MLRSRDPYVPMSGRAMTSQAGSALLSSIAFAWRRISSTTWVSGAVASIRMPFLGVSSFGEMQPRDEIAFRLLCAELVFWSLIESPAQSVQVDLQDEDFVEQVLELREVPRAAAEEGEALPLVGDQGSDSVHVPDVMPVRRHGVRRLTRFWVPLIGQVGVTIDGVEATAA